MIFSTAGSGPELAPHGSRFPQNLPQVLQDRIVVPAAELEFPCSLCQRQ